MNRCTRFPGILGISIILAALIFAVSPAAAEEGMIPLSELPKFNLNEAGFQVSHEKLYNPGGLSIVNSIVKLKGCSGSFVSAKGLILTNYHCAFSSIQSVTTKQNDYMKHGFMARDRCLEIPIKGYTVRLIESYRDVSKQVLGVVTKKMTAAQRTRAIDKKINRIILLTERNYPGHRAEVAEMFIGKTYVLFLYSYIKDVRLVYAPPRAVGEYGGEDDNWMWPRHTGDFAFFRAYTAPDGSFRSYHPDNVSYKPKHHLQIAAGGAKTEDLIFILGYPGRTYRHRTSHFIAFQQDFRLPFAEKLYRRQMDILDSFSEKSGRSVQIKLAAAYKRLANPWKRYLGQLKGMKALDLAKKRKKQEADIQKFINADFVRKKKYGDIIAKLNELYAELRNDSPFDLTIYYLLKSPTIVKNAHKIYLASLQKQKRDVNRKSAYMNRNFKSTVLRIKQDARNFHQPADKMILKELLLKAAGLKGNHRIPAVTAVLDKYNAAEIGNEKAVQSFLNDAYSRTRLHDETFLMKCLNTPAKELEKSDDPFIRFAVDLFPSVKKMEKRGKRQRGIRDKLLARWIDAKKEFLGTNFVPDANSTMRITYGHIRGYSPRDAVRYLPFTTLGGAVKKHTGQEPFNAPQKQIQLYRSRDFGSFVHPKLNEVPVAMLYNADTTGGNSGSPVLNAKGQLVGLNFDRVYEATINDYAWDEKYSRSIGLDIRYVLWFLEKYSEAGHLLKEMKVK